MKRLLADSVHVSDIDPVFYKLPAFHDACPP
jgi:hypothetical protein